jgi:RsiG-like
VRRSSDTGTRLDELAADERALSRARRLLHGVIDLLRGAEPAPRSPHGKQLQLLEEKERDLSARRRKLHDLLDRKRS